MSWKRLVVLVTLMIATWTALSLPALRDWDEPVWLTVVTTLLALTTPMAYTVLFLRFGATRARRSRPKNSTRRSAGPPNGERSPDERPS